MPAEAVARPARRRQGRAALRSPVLLAFALTLALAASGCGSAPLSLRDLRAQASAACRDADRAAQRIPAPRSPADAEAFVRAGIRPLERELATLRTATPPSSSAGDYRTALGSLSAVLSDLRQAEGALRAGGDPVSVVRTLTRRIAPLRQSADRAWRSLEVPACTST